MRIHPTTGAARLIERLFYGNFRPKSDAKIIRGILYVVRKHVPPKYVSPAQARARQRMRDIGAAYRSLTPYERQSWEDYNDSGYTYPIMWRAYFKNNMQLMWPQIPDVSYRQYIASPYELLAIPDEFEAWYNIADDRIHLQWKDTFPLDYYVEVFYYLIPGYKRVFKARWKYIVYNDSPAESIDIYGMYLAAGRKVSLVGRTLNFRGEISLLTEPVEVPVPKEPEPAFSAFPLLGQKPLIVDFIDQSTGEIRDWEWDFDDGNAGTDQNPTHTYQDQGVFSPVLTLYGAAASTVVLRKDRYIEVIPENPPAAIEYYTSIDNTADPVNYYDLQVLIKIPAGSKLYDDLDAGGGNIRFYDSDRETKLPYWRRMWSFGGDSYFWVKVPFVPASKLKYIFVYIFPTGTSSESNGDDTFKWWAGFPGSTLDLTKWTVLQGGVAVSGNHLTLTGTAGTRGKIQGVAEFTPPLIMEVWGYSNTTSNDNMRPGSLYQIGDSTQRLDYAYGTLASRFYFITQAGGAQTRTDNVVINNTTDLRWYKTVWTQQYYKFYQDNVLKLTHTTNIPQNYLAPLFWEGTKTGWKYYVYYVLIRQFCTTDPPTLIIE